MSVPLGFGLGYLFADRGEKLLANVHSVERWLTVLALAAVAVWVAVTIWRRSRRLLAPDIGS